MKLSRIRDIPDKTGTSQDSGVRLSFERNCTFMDRHVIDHRGATIWFYYL